MNYFSEVGGATGPDEAIGWWIQQQKKEITLDSVMRTEKLMRPLEVRAAEMEINLGFTSSRLFQLSGGH